MVEYTLYQLYWFSICAKGGSYVFITARRNNCTYGQIRLRNGFTNREGRVEICVDGTWGTVCDNGWSYNDARVVCRQLGFPTIGEIEFEISENCIYLTRYLHPQELWQGIVHIMGGAAVILCSLMLDALETRKICSTVPTLAMEWPPDSAGIMRMQVLAVQVISGPPTIITAILFTKFTLISWFPHLLCIQLHEVSVLSWLNK